MEINIQNLMLEIWNWKYFLDFSILKLSLFDQLRLLKWFFFKKCEKILS